MAERSISVRLRAEVNQFKSDMAAAGKAASDAASKTETAWDKSSSHMGKMMQHAKQNEAAWNTAGTTLTAVGAAITAVGVAAAKTGIEYNTLQQTSRAAMTTLMGGAQEANAQMDKLDAFARKSPFAKQTFIQAQQQLIGFGVEAKKVVPTLEAVQDAVAAFGGSNKEISSIVDIMARLQSQGRLSGEALERFGYYGVDAAKIIAEQMGTTSGEIKDMASKPGGIPVDQIWDPLVTGLTERFGGAAANVKETFEGAIDRVKAAWRDLSASLTEPLVGPEGGGLAVDGLNKLADAMRQFESVPRPIRDTSIALGGLVGAASLAGGGFLLLMPRIVETQQAFQTLAGQQGIVGKATRSIGSVGTVAQKSAKGLGVATVAFLALGAAAGVASAAVEKTETKVTQSKLFNDIQTSQNAADALRKIDESFQGVVKTSDKANFSSVDSFADALDRIYNRSFDDKMNDWMSAPFKWAGATPGIEKARAAISELDGALMDLVSAGDFDKAQGAFARMSATAEQSGVSMGELLDELPQYKTALTELATEAKMGADESTLLAIATGQVTPEMLRSAEAAGASKTAIDGVAGASSAAAEELQKARDAVIGAADGFLDFAGKAKDAEVSTAQWIADFEKQVTAQAEWVMNLEKLQSRGASRELLEELYSLGTDGAKRVKDLADGSDENITRLNDAFDSGARNAEYLSDVIVDIPDVELAADVSALQSELRVAEDELEDLEKLEPTPVVNASIKKAEDKIKDIERKLEDLDGMTVKTFVVTDSFVTNMHPALLNPNRSSTGIPTGDDIRNRHLLPGPYKRASGGSVIGPGTGTSDDILALLSNGEHVLTAEEVRRMGGHAEVYRMRNAIMSGDMPAFAAGGAVSSAKDRLARAERDLERIQNRGKPKPSKSDREREAAQKRVERARDQLRKAEERQRDAERKAEERKREAERRRQEEQARRERVTGLRSDLRTDVRRGSIRDQVTGSLSGGYSAVDRLFGLGKNEDLSKSARNVATTRARKFESDLKRLYGQAERLDEKLKAAQDKASELEGIQKSVASGLLSGRDLDMGDYMNFSGGQWTTHTGVAGATRRMTADVGRMKEFANKLQKLMKAGIPGAILQEIAGAGVDEGIALADAFLNASSSEQQSYISTWNEYEKQANRIGNIVTGGFYDGGVDAARGVVNGLESQQKSIENQIAKLAKSMEDTLKSVLGIRSPSRVMAELGAYTAEGLVQGLLSGQSDVAGAASMLAAAAVPAIALDVKATPVMDTDALAATSAMQDMSAVTLQAMQMMRADVSAGWDSMLADTSAKQFSMRDITAAQQEEMRAVILGKQTAAKDSLTQMQESMRSTVADRQLRMRDNIASQQESMRSVMADKQTQMRDKNRTEFESMRATTGEKLTSMRSSADSTMTGFKGDYDGHMGSLKRINRDGHASMEDASEAAFKGIRSGMNTQMREAKPELGGKMNNLIDVLAKFTSSVNKAFGDVGVDLSSPQKLAFAAGGVMPGYTPGRDVHSFYSPTAGSLYLSGGEAIMRPEFTRAVGGEKGVKELNAAARRGDSDYLNQALHFAQGGVMPSAPMRGVNAFADSGVWRGLWAIVKSAFPNAIKTSDYRPGSRTVSGNSSYHSRGMAVDVSPSMGIFNYLHDNYGGSNEIIYSPANGRQIKNGSHYMYRGGVRAQHFNHVHWANSRVPGGAAGGPAGSWDGDVFVPHPFLDKAGVSADGDLKAAYERAAKKQIKDIIGKHSGQLSGGEFSRQLGTGIMRATRDGLIKKATDYGELMGDGGIPGAANGPVKQMAREVLEKMGWGDQWADLDWLVTRESGWNPNAQNPTSTAYGLFQFLNGTWGSVGAKKTSDPLKQIQAGLKYIQQRYGDVRGARRFWERNNWYKDGTKNAKSGWAVVGEEGPELVNLGGGERIESNPQTRKALAANRTFLPAQGGGVDAGQIAKIVASELAKRPQNVVNVDSTSHTETGIARKVSNRLAEDTSLYLTGV